MAITNASELSTDDAIFIGQLPLLPEFEQVASIQSEEGTGGVTLRTSDCFNNAVGACDITDAATVAAIDNLQAQWGADKLACINSITSDVLVNEGVLSAEDRNRAQALYQWLGTQWETLNSWKSQDESGLHVITTNDHDVLRGFWIFAWLVQELVLLMRKNKSALERANLTEAQVANCEKFVGAMVPVHQDERDPVDAAADLYEKFKAEFDESIGRVERIVKIAVYGAVGLGGAYLIYKYAQTRRAQAPKELT